MLVLQLFGPSALALVWWPAFGALSSVKLRYSCLLQLAFAVSSSRLANESSLFATLTGPPPCCGALDPFIAVRFQDHLGYSHVLTPVE